MVSPKYCKFYIKVVLNHVDYIENITSNVRFDFVGFTCRVESIIVTVVQFLLLHRKEPGVARELLQLSVSGNWTLTRISLKLLEWQ